MHKPLKIFTTTFLLLIFLLACTTLGSILFFSAWLHTYHVFTERTLVAQVSVSKIHQDVLGEYMNVEYKPLYSPSALTSVFNTSQQSSDLPTQNFKIYGDSVHIGGPIVKFYDHLILVNFKTIYKVGKLYGRYNIDNAKEQNRTVISSYDLHGGIDATWQDLNDRTDSFPYSLFVDTTQLSTPGIFGSTKSDFNYNLYITPTGFLWEKQAQ